MRWATGAKNSEQNKKQHVSEKRPGKVPDDISQGRECARALAVPRVIDGGGVRRRSSFRYCVSVGRQSGVRIHCRVAVTTTSVLQLLADTEP